MYVAEELAQKLRDRFAELGLTEWLSVEAQPNGEGDNTYPEPRQIYVRYKSLYADNLQYLLPYHKQIQNSYTNYYHTHDK